MRMLKVAPVPVAERGPAEAQVALEQQALPVQQVQAALPVQRMQAAQPVLPARQVQAAQPELPAQAVITSNKAEDAVGVGDVAEAAAEVGVVVGGHQAHPILPVFQAA